MNNMKKTTNFSSLAVRRAAAVAAALIVAPLLIAPAAAQDVMPAAPAAPEPATAPVVPAPVPAAAATAPPVAVPEVASQLDQQTASYNEGWNALKAGELDKAGDAFTRVLAIAPTDSMARALLGYVRLKQERYDDALNELQNPQLADATLDAKTRAVVQNNIGTAYWNTKRYALALPAYENAVKLDANYADARYNMALALLSQKRAKEALPHFQKLAKANPRDPLFFDGLGQAYEQTAQWKESFDAYRKAMTLSPNDSSYPFNLAMAILHSDPNGAIKGRHDAAATALRKTIALNPKAAPAFLQLGLILIEKSRWTDAQDILRRYVELVPDDFTGQFDLGLAYDYSASFDDALRAYANAEKLQPNDVATKNNIGRIYLKRKQYDDAVAHFREALALQPDFLDARNNLAMALGEKGDLSAANVEWNTLIGATARQLKSLPATKTPSAANAKTRAELTARLAAARGALAGNLLRDGKYAEAVSAYKNLLAVSPNNAGARSNLGLALYNTKQYPEAVAAYDQILKSDPKNAVAHNNRGVVLEAMGKKTDAIVAYQKAIALKPDYAEAKSNRDRLLAATKVG